MIGIIINEMEISGSFKEALELYKKVLEINPNCPPCVRNGIALCFYKIGRVNLARKWFERGSFYILSHY